jgi:uncharacterized protein (DUF305 family)
VSIAFRFSARAALVAAVLAGSASWAHAQANPADVAFMQGMITHHAQAIAMAALIPARTARREIHLLGERITVSQKDEIALMQHWLERHNEKVPGVSDHPGHAEMAMTGDSLMPGMLTPAEMAQLAGATGSVFDTLFLRGMIRHHGGALAMVARLFASPGAAQDPEVFRFASDVDADQRAEIARMQQLLDTLSTGARRP